MLTGYIDEHTLIGEAQAGFRTGRNTTHQLQQLRLALEDAKLTKSDIQVLYWNSRTHSVAWTMPDYTASWKAWVYMGTR